MDPRIDAAVEVASSLGLQADDAVVLQAANRVTARLLPCDVVVRVAPLAAEDIAELEVDLARRLAEAGSPVATLDPRVEPITHVRDGFVVTCWTYCAPTGRDVAPAEYADALARLHLGMRTIDRPVPSWTDRVDDALAIVDDTARSPALEGADRTFLSGALRGLRDAIIERGATEQLLHGEPHPGNVLSTSDGVRFVDLETCCTGPVAFDVAHAPDEIAGHYSDLDDALLRDCRHLSRALVTSWRWDRDDEFPNGRRMGVEWLAELRAAIGP